MALMSAWIPAPPPESDPAIVNTCLSDRLISVSGNQWAYIYFATEVCPASAKDQRGERASECIANGHHDQQQKGQEQIGERGLGIGLPERRQMRPQADADQADHGQEHTGAATSAKGSVVPRREAQMKQQEHCEYQERYRVDQRNDE